MERVGVWGWEGVGWGVERVRGGDLYLWMVLLIACFCKGIEYMYFVHLCYGIVCNGIST